MDNKDFFEEEKKEEPLDELFIDRVPKRSYFSCKLIGFFVPVIGFTMYFVYKKNRSNEANAFLDGAMVGTFTQVILLLLIIGYANSLY